MEVLIFFATLWVLWLISSRWWKRQIILPLAIIGLIYVIITSPVGLTLVNQGLTFTIPQDSGEKVDAIVVLGRGDSLRAGRVELAAKLWKQDRAPIIFISGMLDAEEIITDLQGYGISKLKLSGERCSQNTEENAQYTTAVLYPQGIKKILLITDSPHMLRSRTLFQNYGFQVISYQLPLTEQWSANQQLIAMLREYAGLMSYHWQGRFRQRTPDEITNPSQQVKYRLKEWNCYLKS